MAADDSSWAVVVVNLGDRQIVVGRFDDRHPDLSLVDGLARMQLLARRHGGSIRVGRPSSELLELLDLAGLVETIGVVVDLPLEEGREPERGEELGVEVVVDPGDPTV